MKTVIVLMSGKQGSGKDSVSNKVATSKHIMVKQLKFAGPIYALHDQFYKKALELGVVDEIDKKDGPLLQLLGTEWGRNKDPEIWIKAFKYSVSEMVKACTQLEFKHLVIMVTDCRFENEFDSVDDMPNVKSLKVRLECPAEVRKTRADSWRENDTHLSETALDDHAVLGKFDISLRTDQMGISECSDIIECEVVEMLKGKFNV